MKEKKELPDFKNVENGPLDESNRECRDVFCCILFLLNIAGMIYVTIHGYIDGNPYYIYRGIGRENSGFVECGKSGTAAEKFPYVYFYNPFDSFENRVCVEECPSYSGNRLSTLKCSTTSLPSDCGYDYKYNEDGTL
jgi:hypothetical protein